MYRNGFRTVTSRESPYLKVDRIPILSYLCLMLLLFYIALQPSSYSYSFDDYDLSALKRPQYALSLSLPHSLHSLTVLLRDDPYTTTISTISMNLVFNVYDIIITGNDEGSIPAEADCVSAYYLQNMQICLARNSTESTEFSSDGKTITSSCLYLFYFYILDLLCWILVCRHHVRRSELPDYSHVWRFGELFSHTHRVSFVFVLRIHLVTWMWHLFPQEFRPGIVYITPCMSVKQTLRSIILLLVFLLLSISFHSPRWEVHIHRGTDWRRELHIHTVHFHFYSRGWWWWRSDLCREWRIRSHYLAVPLQQVLSI